MHTESRRDYPVQIICDGAWAWSRPRKLFETNWADQDNDEIDVFPLSCVDFAFAATMARPWSEPSRFIIRDGDFPDTVQNSDHWPIFVNLGLFGNRKLLLNVPKFIAQSPSSQAAQFGEFHV